MRLRRTENLKAQLLHAHLTPAPPPACNPLQPHYFLAGYSFHFLKPFDAVSPCHICSPSTTVLLLPRWKRVGATSSPHTAPHKNAFHKTRTRFADEGEKHHKVTVTPLCHPLTCWQDDPRRKADLTLPPSHQKFPFVTRVIESANHSVTSDRVCSPQQRTTRGWGIDTNSCGVLICILVSG